jgi:GTPase-associated protein 1
MSFQQVYYTSCEKGLSPGPGFQVNAAGPDVVPATLQRIERLGSYAPPRSAPLRPTLEEIARLPVSLFFQTLDGAGAVLGQARYVGLMADGRYGNFFTHSLISTDPYADFFKASQLLPIEMWQSKSWVTRESDSTALPDLEKMPAGEVINFANVLAFLREPSRREILPRFLSAVVEALKTNRRVIVIDDNENVALWVAAASYALPYHLVLRLTFSTYVQSPYNTDALITGTTEDSPFNFAPHEIEHLFSVFDLKGGRLSPIEPGGFAAKAAFLYQQAYAASLVGFPAFVERVAPNMPLEELEDALSTYCYFENLHLPDVDDVSVLAWSSKYGATLADRDFTNLFGRITAKRPVEAETLHAATDFYIATLNPAVNSPSLRRIEDLYFQWLVAEAGGQVGPAVFAEAADKLPRRAYQGDADERVFKEWLKQLKDADDPARFVALLRLGDKMGFVEREHDILLWLGKNVAGGWLADAPLQQALREVSAEGGGRSLLEGAAAFLVEKVDDLRLFSSLATLISDDDSYRVLVNYAVKTQNLPLFLRLGGMRANLSEAQPERVAALGAQFSAVQTYFKTGVTAEIVQTAYASIWLSQPPTLGEAYQLLSPPLVNHVVQSEIPGQLLDSLNVDDEALTPPQMEVIRKLNSDEIYNTLDGKGRATVNAYVMAVEFQCTPEIIDEGVTSNYLSFLAQARQHLPPLAPRLYKFLGRKFVHVKDVDLHARGLPEHIKAGGGSFLQGYQEEVVELSRAKKTHDELARLFSAWTIATSHTRGLGAHVRSWVGFILKNQSKRDLEMLEAALDDDTYKVWLRTRVRVEEEQKGALGRFFDNILGRG